MHRPLSRWNKRASPVPPACPWEAPRAQAVLQTRPPRHRRRHLRATMPRRLDAARMRCCYSYSSASLACFRGTLGLSFPSYRPWCMWRASSHHPAPSAAPAEVAKWARKELMRLESLVLQVWRTVRPPCPPVHPPYSPPAGPRHSWAHLLLKPFRLDGRPVAPAHLSSAPRLASGGPPSVVTRVAVAPDPPSLAAAPDARAAWRGGARHQPRAVHVGMGRLLPPPPRLRTLRSVESPCPVLWGSVLLGGASQALTGLAWALRGAGRAGKRSPLLLLGFLPVGLRRHRRRSRDWRWERRHRQHSAFPTRVFSTQAPCLGEDLDPTFEPRLGVDVVRRHIVPPEPPSPSAGARRPFGHPS